MTSIQAIEIQRKTLANGHIIITYKAGDFVYYNEYLNEEDAQQKDTTKLLSKSYIQKDKTGGYTHIYVHPQKPSQILKTLAYNKENQLYLETHFGENKNKTLMRTYHNNVLQNAWSYSESGQIKLGTFYKKNNQNKYEISGISHPIFDKSNELSHLVLMETLPDGHATGFVLERTFYLSNKPAIRVNYTKINNGNTVKEEILSHEDGKWVLVSDGYLKEQLRSIFKEMISLEPKTKGFGSMLEKNSDISFEELYYHDVLQFKKSHPDLHVFIPITETTQQIKPA